MNVIVDVSRHQMSLGSCHNQVTGHVQVFPSFTEGVVQFDQLIFPVVQNTGKILKYCTIP